MIDTLMGWLGEAYELLRQGFTGVNQVQGLLIGIIAALLMKEWKRLWFMAAAAAVIHVIITAMVPVLDGGPFRLPDLVAMPFWLTLIALFLGYVVVIAVFFFIKKSVLKA